MRKFDLDLFRKITYVHFLTDYGGNDFVYPPLFVRDSFNEEKKLRDYLENIKRRFSDIVKGVNIYVHFPLCRYKCTFCRQFCFACRDSKIYNEYLNLLIKELRMWVGAMETGGKLKIKSLYLGGGTPTNFDLRRFFYQIAKFINLNNAEQIEVESTMDALLDVEKLSFFKENKWNQKVRLLIGVQSFNQKVLTNCNRFPYQKRIYQKIMENIRQSKIPVVGFDLMMGLPGQSEGSFIRDLKFLIDQGIELIHPYTFSKSPLTLLWKKEKVVIQKERRRVKEAFYRAMNILASKDYQFTGGEWVLNKSKKLLSHQHFNLLSSPYEKELRYFAIPIGPSAEGLLPFYGKFGAVVRNVNDLNIYKKKILNNNFAVEKIWKIKNEKDLKRRGLVRIMRFPLLDKKPYQKKYGEDPEEDFPEEFKLLEKTLTRLGKFERERDVINFKNNLGGHLILSKVFYSPEVLKRCKKVIEEKYKNLDFDLSFLPHNEDFFIKKT